MKLAEFCTPQPKSKIKAGDGNSKGKYKFFTSSNLQSKRIDIFTYDKPALIFGTGGNASVHYCDTPFSTSTDCIVMYGTHDVELKTVFRYLSCNMRLLEDGFKGAGLKHVSKDYILNIDIPLPPLEMQKQIADTLDQASRLIDLRKQQLAKMDELVKAKFIDMFGDPVMNEKGWGIKKLSEMTSSRLGKMLDAKQQKGGKKFPYLANFNVQWFNVNLSELNIMEFDESDQKEFELKKGDLLVCEGGEVGRCAIWNHDLIQCFFQKALHRIRCNSDILIPEFLARWFYFKSRYNKFEDVVGGQATIAHLTGVKLKNLNVIVPPLPLQNEYAAFVKKVEAQKAIMQQALDKLETNYKALMQQYFG